MDKHKIFAHLEKNLAYTLRRYPRVTTRFQLDLYYNGEFVDSKAGEIEEKPVPAEIIHEFLTRHHPTMLESGGRCGVKEMYDSFKTWCRDTKKIRCNLPAFTKAMENAGFRRCAVKNKSTQNKEIRVWRGRKLNNPENQS